MSLKNFWIISGPPMPTVDKTWQNITAKCNPLSTNWKFKVPNLRVGTLDTLMTLSDDLVKVDVFCEQVTRRIGGTLLKIKDPNAPQVELNVNGASMEVYLTKFTWSEAKYPIKSTCQHLVDMIQTQVGKIEEEFRTRSAEFQTASQSLAAENKKREGSLAVRDLTPYIKPSLFPKSEYITTVFVVLQKHMEKEFLAKYETLCSHVVPRSANKLTEDGNTALYSVHLFKRVVDEFKAKARENKFQVREYKQPDKALTSDEHAKAVKDNFNTKRNQMFIWCKANFVEAFVAWIHLKAIRVHVESILRYGLPAEFQAVLMKPIKGKDNKLHQALEGLFAHLSGSSYFNGKDDGSGAPVVGLGNEKFYPYVYLDIDLNMDK